MDALDEGRKAIPPPPLHTQTMDERTQNNKKRNLSEESLTDADDRKKILKESTSPKLANRSNELGETVGPNFSIIDLSGSMNDVSLHASLCVDSTSVKSKSLAYELSEALSNEYLDSISMKDRRKDPLYDRMAQVKNSMKTNTSTPIRPTQSLFSSFVNNVKRLNSIEGGATLGNENSDEPGNKTMAENTSLTQENNMCLKDISKVLKDVNKTVNSMSERLDQLELHVEKTIIRLDNRLAQNDRLIEVLADEIVAKTDDMKLYVDNRVTSVTKELPSLLATMGKDVDAKIAQNSETLLQTMEERVSMLPTAEIIQEICNKGAHEVITERKVACQTDLEILTRRIEALERGQTNNHNDCFSSKAEFDLLKEQVSDIIRNNERSHLEFSDKINEAHSKIDRIQNEDQFLNNSGNDRSSWRYFRQRTEDVLDRLPKVEHVGLMKLCDK